MKSSTSRLTLHLQTSRFFILNFKHVILSVLTLGWYRFFTKTEIRQYIWSGIRLDNEPLEYTGTGKELLIGFLKALGFIAIVYPLFLLFTWLASGVVLVLVWTAFIVGLYLITQIASYGALRYRLSRTTYRGIRFNLVGSAKDFALRSLVNFILVILTFGFYVPISRVRGAKYIVDNIRYGNHAFHYDDSSEPPYASFLWAYLLTIPTLGLCWIWYTAAMTRHIVGNISVGNLQFECENISGKKLLRLWLSNLALFLCSFGLLFPLNSLRTMRLVFNELVVVGTMEFNDVRQTAESKSATSEGMAELLEVELG